MATALLGPLPLPQGPLPPDPCRYCQRVYLTAPALDAHIKMRHPTALFCPCPTSRCAYTTKVKRDMILHYLRVHCAADIAATCTTATPHECKVCGRPCKSNAAFHYHVLAAGCLPCPSPLKSLKPPAASRTSETSQSSDTDESQTPQTQ